MLKLRHALILAGLVEGLAYGGLALGIESADASAASWRLLIALGIAWMGYISAMAALARHEPAPSQGFFVVFVVLGFGLLYRCLMLWLPPLQENDYLRYLFDGRLLQNGFNPYTVTPSQFPELGGNTIPKPEIKTIYPPLAEGLFWLSVKIGDSVEVWRRLLLLADLGCAWILYRMLHDQQRSPLWLLGYLWNPLVLKELLNSGHVDGWTLLALLGFVYHWQRRREGWAGLCLLSATLIKLIPGVLILPWMLAMASRKKRLAGMIAGGLGSALAFFPFFPGQPFDSLLLFLTHIQGYGVFFNSLALFLSPENARVALTAFGGFSVYYLCVIRRRYGRDNAAQVLELMGVVFLFSSMGFPWYLAAVVPLAAFVYTPYFWWFAASSQLTYYAVMFPGWWIGVVVSGGFLVYSLGIAQEFCGRRS